MLKNLKQIEGRALKARDGIIGEVKDVYFDDQFWHVRYLVVKTGSWSKQRRVLIAPAVLSSLDWNEQTFPVNLSIDQVRSSPSIDTDKPVSRQREEELRRHYGWPPYWGAGFGETGFVPPMPPPIPARGASEPEYTDGNRPLEPIGDPNLRSANDTLNYHIAARNGEIGHVDDFLFDDQVWRVRYLVVDTKNWLPGKKVIVAPDWISHVTWATRKVHVDLSREAIAASPVYDSNAPWNVTYADELHDYYRRPRYSDWEKDITADAPPTRYGE